MGSSAAVSSQQLQDLVGPGPANPSRPVNIGDAGVAFILAAAGSIPGGAPTVSFKGRLFALLEVSSHKTAIFMAHQHLSGILIIARSQSAGLSPLPLVKE